MQAPTACILGLPALTRRSKNPWRRGLKRIAVSVGKYRAWRSRALPALDSRVRFLTDVPLRCSRGASPAEAAADWALGCCSTAGNSARTVVAVWRPTPGDAGEQVPVGPQRRGGDQRVGLGVHAVGLPGEELDGAVDGLAGGAGQRG